MFEEKDLEQAIGEWEKVTQKSVDELREAFENGTLETELKDMLEKERKQRKIRLWFGFVGITLQIMGLVLLVQIALPVTLLKVGLFALWLAIGLLTTR